MTEIQYRFQIKSHELRQVEDKMPDALVPIHTDDNTERLTSAIFGESSEKKEVLQIPQLQKKAWINNFIKSQRIKR